MNTAAGICLRSFCCVKIKISYGETQEEIKIFRKYLWINPMD